MANLTLRANVTTDSSGNATVYLSQAGQSPYPLAPLGGMWRVQTISYIKNEFASGVDFAITEYETGQSIWTETNVDASETNTDGVTIADSQIKIAITSGGNTKSGQFVFHLTDQLPDITNVTGGGLSDGDYGDITVSGTGTAMTIDAGAVTAAKTSITGTPSGTKFLRDDWSWQAVGGGGDLLAANNLSDVANAATARTNLGLAIGTNVQAYDAELAALAGLTSAADKGIQFTGSGTAGTYDLTAAGKALLDDADAAAQRTTLGLGTLATQSGTFSGTSSGTNTGDQTSIVGITGTKAEFNTAVSDGNIQFVGDAPTAHTHTLSDITDEGALAALNTVGTSQIDNDAVTYAKMQNVSATDKVLGRSSSGAGDVEEIACTSAGRALLDDADAAAQRTTLGLVIGTNVQAYDAELAALAGLTSAADKGIQFTGSGTAATYDLTAAGKALLDDADAAAQRTTLGLVIGTNVQAYDAELAAIAGLTSAADKGIQFTGSGTAATYDLTTAGKALLDDADAAAQRTTLGVLAAELTAAPGSDHTFSGPSVSMTAGEALAFPEVVYVKSDGKLWKADADAASTAPVFAMASASISADASGVFILPGSFVRDDTWTWTVGGMIYLSTTAGGLTQTAPSGTDDVIQCVGIATHADRMWFKPDLTFITHT